MKTGILCNPHSGRLRRQAFPAPAAFAAATRSPYRQVSSLPEIGAALDTLLGEDLDVLAVAGGDGTVQAALTHLFRSHGGVKWPLLTLIPAGTTNMTALDLGVRGSPKRVLQRLQRYRREPVPVSPQVQRRVLRIERPGEADLYGLFFGAGAIASGVRYFHKKIRHFGMTSEIAGGLVTAWLLTGLLTGRSGEALMPARLAISNPPDKRQEGAFLIAFVTTLDRLLLGTRPYWGLEGDPLHVTLVRESPRRFWRSLLHFLYGHGDRLAANGDYNSFNAAELGLQMDDDFMIDGELYRAPGPESPMQITPAGPVTFFVP